MAFQKGKSGNPAGRPKGAKDRRTELRELLSPHAPALINKAVELALQGDIAALRLCLDRICPPLRPAAAAVTFKPVGDTLTDQARAIVDAMANGTIPPDQAATMITALSAMVRIVESDEFNRRLTELEAKEGEPISDEFL